MGEQPGGGSWIATVPGRGYSFAGDLHSEAGPVQGKRSPVTWWWIASAATAALAVALVLASQARRPASVRQAAPLTSFPGREMWPAFSSDGGKLYFVWEKSSGQSDLHVLEPNSPQPTALTHTGEAKGHLALSPDGRTLAYYADAAAGTEIRVIPAVGGEPRVVVHGPAVLPVDRGRLLTWTPDSQSLVYVRMRDAGRTQLVRFPLTGGDEQPVTALLHDYPYDSNPAYSPDGATLAFVRWAGYAIADVWVAPCAPGGDITGEPRRLTHEGTRIQGIAWNADSRSLVVALQKERLPSLWTYRLTNGQAEAVPGAGVPAMHPAISRDGGRLAYVSDTSAQGLWEMEVPQPGRPASPPRLITESTFVDNGPAYSPDGKSLAFYSTRSGNHELWISSLDGKDVRQLTFRGMAFAGAPHWSPDGSLLVYDSRDRVSDVQIVPAAGGAVRRVTATPEEEAVPSFSRDGHWLYYASNRSGRMQVWKSRVDGSDARPFSSGEGFYAMEWTDGFVYYSRRRLRPEIWRIPASGGREDPVLTADELPSLWAYWHLAPQGIYFVSHPDPVRLRSAESSLYLLPWGAKTARRLGPLPSDLPVEPGLAVSPDGKRIAFPRMTQPRSDLMELTNK